MNNKFDELTKNMAQSVTRRAALKKFGVGLAGMALACLGSVNRAEAEGCHPSKYVCFSGPKGRPKECKNCCSGKYSCSGAGGYTVCICM